jgi:WD40 repeat protein
MKYINIIFLLLISNVIIAMEAERKSLASFFNIANFMQHKDVPKAIAQQYVSDKQWWYVDKQIQFYGEKKTIPKMLRYKSCLKSVCFDDTDTKIIAFPKSEEDCYACIWNRDGKELECLDYDALYAFCENNDQWATKLCNSGNSPWGYDYEKDTKELLEKRFDQFAMICWNEEKAYVVPEFRVCNGCRLIAWDQKEDKILFGIYHQGIFSSVEFNPCGIEIITASTDKTMRLWNKKTGKELLRVNYDNRRVTSASFNGMGTEIVVATDDGNIQILAKYHTDNLQQILLNKLLHVWLVLQKPSKEISSVTKLLDSVAQLLRIDWSELYRAWASFPEHVQRAMWLSMSKKIQRYGK